MLQTMARAMQERFGNRDTYRIGGDEFVAFVKDEALDSIEGKLMELHTYLTEQGYHASIGICRQKMPIDMTYMIKQAEIHMYEEKNSYYEECGLDRKRRS